MHGFEIDVFLKDIKVAIEYDGKLYHDGPKKGRNDLNKQAALTSFGHRFLRVREHPLEKINDYDIIIPTSSMLTKDDLNRVVLWIDGKRLVNPH